MIIGKNWQKEFEKYEDPKDLPYGSELFSQTDTIFSKLKKRIEKGEFSDLDYKATNTQSDNMPENYAFRLKNKERVYLIDQYDSCINCCKDSKQNSYYYLIRDALKKDIYKCLDCGKMYYSYKDEIDRLIDSYSEEDIIKIRNFDSIRHLYPIDLPKYQVMEIVQGEIIKCLNTAENYSLKKRDIKKKRFL